MKARAFRYIRVRCVEEALAAWQSAEEPCYIAGGQSLVPSLALRLRAPDLLIDLAHIEEMRRIALDQGRLRIGALTRHAEVLRDPRINRHAPLLSEAAKHVAHPAIRNKGTIGGSIALADPAAEFPAMMLALDADIEITGSSGTRVVASGDYFQDLFQTALEPGEILTAILVPPAQPHQRSAFGELARRRGDYAMVGVGLRLTFDDSAVGDARVAFFSVGSTPVRARSAEAALTGHALTDTSIVSAQQALSADLDPPDDEAVPAAMRIHLARVLLARTIGRIITADEPLHA